MDSIEEKIEIKIQGGKFKQFDIIEEASSFGDHHYYSRHRPKNYSDQLRKRISQEWETFKVRLPDSIFVRANMERPDLLRAVIVGPQGSPYHDGLFFFDIQFPSKYPDIPPKFHYCCFDVRLMNHYIPYAIPLGPFEKIKIPWNSSTSTVLGLLLSVHKTLVHRGGNNLLFPKYYGPYPQLSTLRYKEYVFKGNWSTMVSVLDNPPKCFEEFVTQHFHDQAETILATCKTYISWRINTVDLPNPWQGEFDSLKSIYYQLVTAFQKNGSSLDDLSKLRIEFQGKPAWPMRVRVIIAVVACVFGIFLVVLMYHVIGGLWKQMKEIRQA